MIAPAWTEAAPAAFGDTAVWRIDLALDEPRRATCLAMLSDEERRRAERFLRAEDRDRFVASHAALRLVLAGELGADPAALSFDADFGGKPRLAGAFGERLAFNLSHSGAVALVAISPDARIGVDVEAARPIGDALRIARTHFAPSEVRSLSRLSGNALSEAFFACWTCKEAYAKAVGVGLSAGLDRFAVAILPEPAALVEIDGDPSAASAWSLYAIAPDASYAAAVAVERADADCALRRLRPGWPA